MRRCELAFLRRPQTTKRQPKKGLDFTNTMNFDNIFKAMHPTAVSENETSSRMTGNESEKAPRGFRGKESGKLRQVWENWSHQLDCFKFDLNIS